MPNPALNNDFSAKTANKIYKILALVGIFLLLFFLAFIYFQQNRNKYFEKSYKKEIKSLNISLDSLKKDRSEQDKKTQQIEQRISDAEAQAKFFALELQDQYKKINTIKKGYEKINSYVNISNDSLRRIFADRFGK